MIEVILLGVALAMDSLTVSLVNGLKYRDYDWSKMLLASFSFGFFQGFMPLLGYLLLFPFLSYIEKIDHWLVLIILSLIGIDMIKEAFQDEDTTVSDNRFTIKILLLESVATAIDALSCGLVLPTLAVDPYLSCLIIGVVTMLICIIGHLFGKKVALILKDKATIAGGVILILIGIKTVIEHLFF